jgi:hypothetical protein
VSGSGGVVCSWFLLFTAFIAVVRQKFHLSSCADFRGRLCSTARRIRRERQWLQPSYVIDYEALPKSVSSWVLRRSCDRGEILPVNCAMPFSRSDNARSQESSRRSNVHNHSMQLSGWTSSIIIFWMAAKSRWFPPGSRWGSAKGLSSAGMGCAFPALRSALPSAESTILPHLFMGFTRSRFKIWRVG